jgi:hypothetical protein
MDLFGEIDLPIALEFLGGFLEVNASVFGPFVQRALGALKERMGVDLPKGPKLATDEDVPADPSVQAE